MLAPIPTTLLAAAALLGAGPLTRTLVKAGPPPQYPGLHIVWSDAFGGAAGAPPEPAHWNVLSGSLGVNNELQVYTTSPANVGLSGASSVCITPRRDAAASPGGWTSGRLESSYTLTPTPGGTTAVEAAVRFGGATGDAKQGMWAAFWMEGADIHTGTVWPANGELDAMEMVNGVLTGYGTAHCSLCHETQGIGGSVPIPNLDWHVWRVEWQLGTGDWLSEKITWYMDGAPFQEITGETIGDQNVWNSLAHNEMFVILNLAVGGDWPGQPGPNTVEGDGNRFEVGYVAHYSS